MEYKASVRRNRAAKEEKESKWMDKYVLQIEKSGIIIRREREKEFIQVKQIEGVEYNREEGEISMYIKRIKERDAEKRKEVVYIKVGSKKIDKVIEQISNILYNEWRNAEWDLSLIVKMTDAGIAQEKISKWIEKREGIRYAEKAFKERKAEQAQSILKEIGKIQTNYVIEALAERVDLIQKVFEIKSEKGAGITQYIEKEAAERSRIFHWLKIHFYEEILNMKNIEILEKMIVECQMETVEYIGIQSIVEVLTETEIRKAMVQLDQNNKKGLEEFLSKVGASELLDRVSSFETHEHIHIFYLILQQMPSAVGKYLSRKKEIVERIFYKYNQCLEKREWESHLFLHKIALFLLCTDNLSVALIVTDKIHILFEAIGRPTIISAGKWRLYRTQHIFTHMHLKLLLLSFDSLSLHMKMYIRISGILLDLTHILEDKETHMQIIAAQILRKAVEAEDRILFKYLRDIDLIEKIEKTLERISGEKKALSALDGAIIALKQSLQKKITR